MAKKGLKVRPGPILAVAAVAGIGLGLYWSRKQGLEEHVQLDHMAELVESLPPTRFPMPPAEPKTRRSDFRAVEGLPPYPGAMPQKLLSQEDGVGGEMRIAWFETQDTPDDVIYFYEKAFADQGILFVSHFFSEKAGYVAYASPDKERMHMIFALREYGKTTVFPSSSNPGKLLASLNSPLPPEVPQLPGTSTSMVFDFDEKALAQKSFIATVEGKTVEEVTQWYADTFKSKGWQVKPPGKNSMGEATLDANLPARAESPPKSASLTIRRDKASVTVYLTLSG
jgi:hypothetical protein